MWLPYCFRCIVPLIPRLVYMSCMRHSMTRSWYKMHVCFVWHVMPIPMPWAICLLQANVKKQQVHLGRHGPELAAIGCTKYRQRKREEVALQMRSLSNRSTYCAWVAGELLMHCSSAPDEARRST